MPYQPGAVVHGVTHIADVYKSGNVYANNVKVALWLPPGVSEAFAFDPVAAPSTSYEIGEAAPAIAEAEALVAPVVVPAISTENNAVESGYQGTPATAVTTSTGIITSAVSTDFVGWMASRVSEAKRGMWTRVSPPAPKPPASKAASNPNIMGVWSSLGMTWYANHDQTAWCMGFVNFALKQNGYVWCKEAAAKAISDKPQRWNAVNVPLDQGQPGDVALWKYGTGFHVNFIYTRTASGAYTFVGGNQGAKDVSNNPVTSSVSQSWPSGYKVPGNGTLISLWRPSKSVPT